MLTSRGTPSRSLPPAATRVISLEAQMCRFIHTHVRKRPHVPTRSYPGQTQIRVALRWVKLLVLCRKNAHPCCVWFFSPSGKKKTSSVICPAERNKARVYVYVFKSPFYLVYFPASLRFNVLFSITFFVLIGSSFFGSSHRVCSSVRFCRVFVAWQLCVGSRKSPEF